MQFAGGMWNHTPAMVEKLSDQKAEQATVSPDEMGKLAAYLFYVRFLGEPGDAQRGRELFEQRQCVRCHQLGGHGGREGPRLDELSAYASSFFMAQALWNHGPEMTAKMAELRVGRPHLEGNDVADIVALIRGGAQPAAPEIAYDQAGSPRAGKAVFQERGCIKCHAIAGAGGSVGPDLGKPRQTRRVSEMAGGLWNHGPTMWAKMKELGVPFPHITDREMTDLLAYLDFVQYMAGGGDATRGGELFQTKSCAQCHATGKQESGGGPALGAAAVLDPPSRWAAAMWNHAPAMRQKFHDNQPAWPRFDDDEMRDLVEFLRSPSGGK